jgi:DNA-binding beta-propeller fold protein YncE
VIDPATGILLVMNAGDGTVSFIDPVKRSLLSSLMVGGSLEVAAADGRGLVYVNVEDRNEVVVIDARTRAIARRYPLIGCEGPTGLAIVAGGTRLMSACANNVAVVSNPAAGTVTHTIAIGKGPDGLLYDSGRGVALVPTGEGYLEVIAAADPDDIRLIERVATHASARTAALDSRTGRIYLPSADYAAPVAPARRGTQVPGSFQVIVVSPGK